MRHNVMAMALATVAVMGLGMVAAGDDYTIDAAHSGVNFQISHLDLTYVHGRFNEFSGTVSMDPSDPTKASIKMTINADSVNTNNAKRDGHLKSPDFFNSKQFPTIEFVSTSVTPMQGGYQVAGNLTFHGETKPLSFELKGGKTAEFPKGTQRTGYTARFTIKRSEFGVATKYGPPMLGDDVWVDIGFEAVKKK